MKIDIPVRSLRKNTLIHLVGGQRNLPTFLWQCSSGLRNIIMRTIWDVRQGTHRLINSIHDSLEALGPMMEEDRNHITLGPITDIATSNRLRRDPAVIHGLSQFDADLKTMDEIDATLHRLRRHLLAYRNEYQTQLAPISILPVEILRSVFLHVMTSEIGSDGFLRDTPKYVASITHVCRRWRMIALEQAQLWTHVNANWPPDQISTWLSRGTLPLRVTYVHNPITEPRTCFGLPSQQKSNKEDEMQAVNALVSHSHRWRAAKLCFNIGLFGVMHHILNESDFGQLRTLSLHGGFTNQPSAHIDVGAFPRLHSLELRRAHINNLATLCPQLVHLVVSPTRLELEEWAAVLPSCNVLEYLEIGWWSSDRLYPSTIVLPPIPMAKLKTFIVHDVSVRTFTDLVGRVRSPCLSTFSMGLITRLVARNSWRSLEEFLASHETLAIMDVSAVADTVRVVVRSLWGEESTLARGTVKAQRLLLPSLDVLSLRLTEGRRGKAPEADLANLAASYVAQGITPPTICVPLCDNEDELRGIFPNVDVGMKEWGEISSVTYLV